MRKINLIVDILAFLCFFLLVIPSGIILWVTLSHQQAYLALTRPEWTQLHLVTALIFAGLIITHLLLHWCWIKKIPKILKE